MGKLRCLEDPGEILKRQEGSARSSEFCVQWTKRFSTRARGHLTPTPANAGYGGASRVSISSRIGFQPVIFTNGYRQDACATFIGGRGKIANLQIQPS